MFRMMNAPTKTAIEANTSRNVLMNRSPCAMSLCCSFAISAPVLASSPAGTIAAIRSRRTSCDTPFSAATAILL